MPFQFQCPGGHLLEADESQVGQQSQCPVCAQTFSIPSPAGVAPVSESEISPFEAGPRQSDVPSFGPSFDQPASATEDPPPFMIRPTGESPFDPAGQLSGPSLLHIPCPNGHELEVPPEMIGQDVMCPHCGVQFLLREKDSAEAKRRKQQAQELKDFKSGKNWLMWAVIFAVLVLIGLVAMIAVRSGM